MYKIMITVCWFQIPKCQLVRKYLLRPYTRITFSFILRLQDVLEVPKPLEVYHKLTGKTKMCIQSR